MNEVNKITLGQLTCQATHLGYPDPVSLEQILREKGTLTFLCLLDRIEVANARRCLSYRFLQVLLFIYVDSAICLSKGVAKIYNELGINQLEIDGNDYTAPVFGQQYLKTLSDHYLSDQSPLTVYDKALVNALSHFDHPWVIHSSLTTLGGVKGRILAQSGYMLWLGDDGMFYAGCRGPWTKEQALAHWGSREDERAVIFTKAIKELE